MKAMEEQKKEIAYQKSKGIPLCCGKQMQVEVEWSDSKVRGATWVCVVHPRHFKRGGMAILLELFVNLF